MKAISLDTWKNVASGSLFVSCLISLGFGIIFVSSFPEYFFGMVVTGLLIGTIVYFWNRGIRRKNKFALIMLIVMNAYLALPPYVMRATTLLTIVPILGIWAAIELLRPPRELSKASDQGEEVSVSE